MNFAIDLSEWTLTLSRLISLSMFHTFVASLSNLASLRERHTIYIIFRFFKSQFISAIKHYYINEILLVSLMIVSFVNLTNRNFLRNIRFVWCEDALLESLIVKKFYNFLTSNACVAQVYEMTKIEWIFTIKWLKRDEIESVDRLLTNVKTKYDFWKLLDLYFVSNWIDWFITNATISFSNLIKEMSFVYVALVWWSNIWESSKSSHTLSSTIV